MFRRKEILVNEDGNEVAEVGDTVTITLDSGTTICGRLESISYDDIEIAGDLYIDYVDIEKVERV